MHENKQLIHIFVVVLVCLTLVVWLVVHTVRRAENRARMMTRWAFTFPLVALALFSVHLFGFMGVFLIVACAVILSFMWTPDIASLLISPLTSAFDGGNLQVEPRPAYSIALARKNRGRYGEAVQEIGRQLERFPADLEGHLLLAEILAEHLHDLPGAALAIKGWVSQGGHEPKHITFALYSLADWYLRFGQDREGAQECLQQIIDLLPGTEFALGAAQRIAHLGDVDTVLSPLERKKFQVLPGAKYPGLSPSPDLPSIPQVNREQLAAEYVKHLEQHPLDTEAREKLAVLYATHYGRLDLATTQLEQMIAEPNHAAKRVVHWLNVLVNVQIQCGADYETVRQTLQRIIDRFPNIAAADLARNRLATLKLELKRGAKIQTVKLGTYEQRFGLKQT